MAKKLTLERITERMKLECPDYEMTGDVPRDTKTKTLFRHKVCGHEFPMTLNNMFKIKGGCPPCGNKKRSESQRTTRERAIERMELECPDFLMTGEMPANFRTKTVFRHKVCGHEFPSTLKSILNMKRGCPLCSKSGYKVDKPAHLYLLQMTLPDGTECLKYGITNNINTRLQKHRRQGMVLVVEQRHYADGRDAVRLEELIRDKFGGSYVTKEQMPDGYTETLSPEMLGDIRALLV